MSESIWISQNYFWVVWIEFGTSCATPKSLISCTNWFLCFLNSITLVYNLAFIGCSWRILKRFVFVLILFFSLLYCFSFLFFFSLKWQLCHCIYRNKIMWPICIQISLLKIFFHVIKKYTCALYDNNVLMSFVWILKCISLWLLLFVVSWVYVSMGVCVHMCMMRVHVGNVCVASVTCILGICLGIISTCVGGFVWKLCMHLHTQICVCGRLYVCVCVPVYPREREFLCERKLLI